MVACKRYLPDPWSVLLGLRFGEPGRRAARAVRRGERELDALSRERGPWGGIAGEPGTTSVWPVLYGAGNPTTTAAIARQEVPEPIELGQSLVTGHRPAWGPAGSKVPQGAREPDERRWTARALQPLPRETSAGAWRKAVSCRACERKLMHPVRGNPNPRTTRTGGPFDRWGLHLTGSLTPSPARAGWVDTVICSGFGRCVVVLASCPDCRRRREAPDVKSSLRGRRSL